MSRLIENKFDFGEIVYLKTDKEQSPRIVFALKVYENEILYELACGTVVSTNYEFEMSSEINVLTQLT